jgi:hypothetical protein
MGHEDRRAERFERSYTLVGSAGQHEPQVIGQLIAKMVAGRKD